MEKQFKKKELFIEFVEGVTIHQDIMDDIFYLAEDVKYVINKHNKIKITYIPVSILKAIVSDYINEINTDSTRDIIEQIIDKFNQKVEKYVDEHTQLYTVVDTNMHVIRIMDYKRGENK